MHCTAQRTAVTEYIMQQQASAQLTNATTTTDEDCTVTTYECDFIAQCDGSSIWSDTNNKAVRVTGIAVFTYSGDDDYKAVNVTHDSDWQIYTDRGFEAAISAALGYAVSFTEQGMQDDNLASMEA